MIVSKTSKCITEDCGQYDKVEIDGLSADFANAPMKGIATGSIYLCVDSAQIYFFVQQFDEEVDPDTGKVVRTEVEGYWLEA